MIFTLNLRLLDSKVLFIISSFWNNLSRNTRNVLTSYAFLVPSFVSLILFVFIPLLFSFIMSLYDNPSVIELRFAFDYYFDFANVSWRNIEDFFLADTDTGKGIFFNSGLALILIGILFLIYIFISYKALIRIRKDTKSNFYRPTILALSLLSALIVAPAILSFVKIVISVIPAFIKLPIEEYRIVLTVASDRFDFVRVLFNTVFWTAICVFLHVLLGIFLALLMNRDLPGQGFFRSIFILPWAIPSFVSAIIFRSFIFDRQRGFLGSFTKNEDGTNSFSITIMDIIVLALVFVLIVIFFYLLKRMLERYKRSYTENEVTRSLFSIVFGIISIIFGILILNILTVVGESIVNISLLSVFDYKIVDIPSISSTFWFTDYVYVFDIQFYMITFSAIITNVWLGVPFMMVSFLAALQSIPKDLYEAAEIDGAGSWTKFRRITLPLLKPTLMTVSLLGIIWTFNLFNVVYILSTNQNSLTQTNLYQIFVTFIYERFDQGFAGERDFSGASALSFVVFLMLVSFSLVYRKVLKAESIFEGEES